MPQKRTTSLIESLLNVGSGALISYLTWRFIIAPGFDLSVSEVENIQITAIFTVISVIRGFIWRRFFNYLEWRKVPHVGAKLNR